uniref:Uncharacterized protein n=1 Tax=Tanacetum cinerariifolium TaxID=118510 RepID=A0A6L2KUW4_TANCI|nr:hypothetical protein [Tanacetum cinerariifolium]
MPPLDPNNTYIQPPSEIQNFEFIRTLGYDEDPEINLIVISKMVATRLHQPWRAILSVLNRCITGKDSSWDTVRLPILEILWGIVHSANLDFASLIWDEFEWQIVKRSSIPSKMSKLLYTCFTKLIIEYLLSLNKSIPRRSNSKLHSSHDDHLITKLLNTTNGDYKFGMEVPDAMISDAITKRAGYKYYMAKKVESEKAKIIDKPEEQHVSSNKYGRGKVEDPAVHLLLDLRKGLKASRLESLRQKKQPVTGKGSSAAHNKYYSSSDTASDSTLYSSSSNESKESTKETNDAGKSDMNLPDDNPHRDNDDARSHRRMIRMAKGTVNNGVELEYHVSQLKASVISEAQWNNNKGDVSEPRSFERHMSKSTKLHPCFYNNDYTYLVDLRTKKKYTTSIAKHYAARYYKEGIEDRIPER